MSTQQHIYQAAVALLRRGDELLLVEQHELYEPGPTWVLPGGTVEPGELLHEALIREVREETGLTVLHPGHLAYIVQYDNRPENHQLVVYVFEVEKWTGEIACDDPDKHILQACFFPLSEAMNKLEADHAHTRKDPLLAYLHGGCATGSLWLYRRLRNSENELVWYPGAPGLPDSL